MIEELNKIVNAGAIDEEDITQEQRLTMFHSK